MGKRLAFAITTSAAAIAQCYAFSPSTVSLGVAHVAIPFSNIASHHRMMPTELVTDVPGHLSSVLSPITTASLTTQYSNLLESIVPSFSSSSSSNLISFTDQGQNLAGIFFQASLLPYLFFLYFLSFKGNRTPALGNFGFQFLLLFVCATIPGGIIAKGTYGVTLADCDWLHGAAEALLTVTNVLVVFGWRQAMHGSSKSSAPSIWSGWKPKAFAAGIAATYAASCVLGPTLGFGAHSEFLLGLGDLPGSISTNLPWVSFLSRLLGKDNVELLAILFILLVPCY